MFEVGLNWFKGSSWVQVELMLSLAYVLWLFLNLVYLILGEADKIDEWDFIILSLM